MQINLDNLTIDFFEIQTNEIKLGFMYFYFKTYLN